MSITPSVAVDTIKKPAMPVSNGNTLYVGGTGEGNYSSIQNAIDNASEGDTVFVYAYSSPYYEHLKVNKSINLIGENRETTIIDGNQSKNVIKVYYVNDITICGFTIQNSWGHGILILTSSDTIIKNNIISNSHSAVSTFSLSNSSISYNIITSNETTGIWLFDSYNNDIISNIINNKTSRGIYIGQSENDKVSTNVIKNCKIGMELTRNSNNSFSNNQLINNGWGIGLSMSYKNKFFNNIFSDNKYGIFISCANFSENNTFYHNNFINNKYNSYDPHTNIWDDGYPSGGNFWYDYNGTDSNGDGIGGTPYPIFGGDNEDRYPLGNFKPDKPDIDGPPSGKPGVEYRWVFHSEDPECLSICYYIDWGDGNKTDWFGPYPSGMPVEGCHKYEETGFYVIGAKVKDNYDAESNWSEFEVKIEISRNRATYPSMFNWFFKCFPLLEKLLTLIRTV